VAFQRKQYKHKQQGQYSTLTDEREKKLADLDFVFNTRTKEHLRQSIRKRFAEQWMECYEKLVEFKERFGHTGVPRRWAEDPTLATWAMRQVNINHNALFLDAIYTLALFYEKRAMTHTLFLVVALFGTYYDYT
jgi:hypothetical protein